MNCSEVDAAYDEARHMLTNSDEGFAIACVALLLTSSALIVRGEDWVRPLGAVVGGVGGAVFAYVSSSTFEGSCEVRLVATGVGCVTGCILALCVFRAGVAAIGAGAFGTSAHLVYEALPPTPKTWVYYASVGVASVVGGIVAYVQRKHVLRLSSSILGASGVVASTHLLLDRFTDVHLGSIVHLSLVVLMSGLGVVVQRMCSTQRSRGQRTSSQNIRQRRRDAQTSSVPVGIPV